MIVRPGRLLPTVIASALLTGSLALGAGTASAAETCTLGLKKFPVGGEVTESATGSCLLNGAVPTLTDLLTVVAPVTEATTSTGTDSTPSTGTGSGSSAGGALAGTVDAVTGAGNETAGGTSGTGTSSGATTPTSTPPAAGPTVVAGGPALVAQQPAALPAPDVRGGLLAPTGAAGGLVAARVPALAFGTPNPALLLAPPGSSLRTLAGQDEASRVTTTSDVQVLAAESLPGGVGTPAVLGVLILAALAGFALRHRVLSRVRTPDAPTES